MKAATEEMKKQWGKWMGCLYDYLPMKYKEVSERDWAIRRFVWNFKDGKQSLDAARLVAQKIVEHFGNECRNIVFSCIPASTNGKNEMRYKDFSAEVCRLTGCCNAYSAIHIEGERLAIHEWKQHKSVHTCQIISFDTEFFRGKKVLVFDDIVTQGHSYASFACKLESFGASVVGGLFLARTLNF